MREDTLCVAQKCFLASQEKKKEFFDSSDSLLSVGVCVCVLVDVNFKRKKKQIKN